jgi:hypothetical protein
MKKIDVDMGVILPMADNLVLAVVWTDLLVTFYGLREKIRTRFAILRHIDNCLACCGKFVIKVMIDRSIDRQARKMSQQLKIITIERV